MNLNCTFMNKAILKILLTQVTTTFFVYRFFKNSSTVSFLTNYFVLLHVYKVFTFFVSPAL